MIDSATYIKTLNATDCNTTGAHAIGLSFPQDYNEVMFPSITDAEYSFIATDVETKNDFSLRRVYRPANNQQHITGLVDYIRTKGLQAGDVLCLERRTSILNGSNTTKYYLNVIRRHSILILQKNKIGYIVIRNDIGPSYFGENHDVLLMGETKVLNISFKENTKGRKNASTTNDFYDVTLDNQNVSKIIANGYIEIDTITHIIRGVDDVQFVIINQ